MSAAKVPAVDRACTILQAVRERGPMTLAELVALTELNKSSVYYLLQALVECRMLEVDESGRRYCLGVGLVELGAAAAERLTDVTVAKRHLAELLERLNATFVLYQRLSPGEIVLVDKLERVSRLRITVPLGTRLPIQGGSFGRAFLAFDDNATVDEVLAHGLQPFTAKSVLDTGTFLAELAEVRRLRYAVDHDGFYIGVSSVAAPIFGPDGGIRLVVAAVTFTSALDDERAHEWGSQLVEVCQAITATIAHVEAHTSIGVAS